MSRGFEITNFGFYLRRGVKAPALLAVKALQGAARLAAHHATAGHGKGGRQRGMGKGRSFGPDAVRGESWRKWNKSRSRFLGGLFLPNPQTGDL